MSTSKIGNGWSKYELYVVNKLSSLESNTVELRGDIKQLRTDVAKLQVKSGVWGFVGGLLPVTLGIIYWVLG